MPGPPVLASHHRGGRIVATRVALHARGVEAKGFWVPRAELAGFELELEPGPRAGGAAEVRVSVRNAADRPRHLDGIALFFDWVAPAPRGGRAGRAADGVVLAGEPDGSCAVAGALAGARCLGRAKAEVREGRGAELCVELRVGAELAAGERRELDPVAVAVGDDANALLEAFADHWGRATDARTWRPAPLTWSLGGGGPIEEGDLSRVLASLEQLRRALPVEALVLPHRLASLGQESGGLARAAQAVRAAGLIPGLRLAPLRAAPDSELCRAHPDWLLPDDAYLRDLWRVLDPSHDAVLAQLEKSLGELHELGFFLYELEGLDDGLDRPGADPTRGPAVRLRDALEAVRRGVSDEAFLLARGEGPWGPALGVVDAWLPGEFPSGPARDARSQVWTHRRLWVSASGSPDAADGGAMLVVRGDPVALPGGELERWSRAAGCARRADQGVPGSARLVDPLAASPRLAEAPAPQAPPLAIFCDFDGTFSVQDVGATLAARHGGERRRREWARYERGEITPWDYNLAILDGLPVGTEALEAFLAEVDLDPGAEALLDWCHGRSVPFRILSDGFDWNLNRLQALHGVRFAYTANHLRVEHGRWRIAAGAPDAYCGCGTGTCKAAALRAYRARQPGAHLVHIGNGRVSDSCGAVEADTAFAKDSLAEALARRGEPFVPFTTLRDVIPDLQRILDAAEGREVLGKAPATR